MDTSMLAEVSGLDLLRLQSMESPPRGLVLVVGSVGVLLGLATTLPDWEGCLKVLLAQPVQRMPARRSSGKPPPGKPPPGKPPSLWKLLHGFAPATVSPAQRQLVHQVQAEDLGGLMNPRHMEGVSRGAAALAAWLQAAMTLLATEEPVEKRESALFAAPKMERCEVCGKLMGAELLAEHVPACRARQLERGGRQWEQQLQLGAEKQAQVERSRATERSRREKDVQMLPAPAAAPARDRAPPAASPAAPTSPRPAPSAVQENDSLQQFMQPPPPPPPPVSANTWAEQQLRPRAKPGPEARPRPQLEDRRPGYDYLRAGAGFAGTLQARPQSPRSSSSSSSSPRGGAPPPARSQEPAPSDNGTRVLSREEHVKALRARMGVG